MRSFAFEKILIFALVNILSCLALAQQPATKPIQTIWGVASNGVCVCVYIEPSNLPSRRGDFTCSIELGNITTNLLWAWFPPFEKRYEIQLLGPDGKQVRQLKPFFRGLHTQWSGLKPLPKSCPVD